MSQNWKILKSKLEEKKNVSIIDSSSSNKKSLTKPYKTNRKRRREINETISALKASNSNEEIVENKSIGNNGKVIPETLRKYKHLIPRIIAMDCEMVGIGLTGKQSALARCSIVRFYVNLCINDI
jgi:RNA exonuclease 4